MEVGYARLRLFFRRAFEAPITARTRLGDGVEGIRTGLGFELGPWLVFGVVGKPRSGTRQIFGGVVKPRSLFLQIGVLQTLEPGWREIAFLFGVEEDETAQRFGLLSFFLHGVSFGAVDFLFMA